jgi:hypothetical protein
MKFLTRTQTLFLSPQLWVVLYKIWRLIFRRLFFQKSEICARTDFVGKNFICGFGNFRKNTYASTFFWILMKKIENFAIFRNISRGADSPPPRLEAIRVRVFIL